MPFAANWHIGEIVRGWGGQGGSRVGQRGVKGWVTRRYSGVTTVQVQAKPYNIHTGAICAAYACR